MDNLPPPQKKGLGALGWLGIGCGGLVLIGVIVFAVVGMKYGGQIKEFAEEAQKNPTRAVATTMVKAGMGQFELIAEDEVNKRYTVRQKANGALTTIYWSVEKQAPVTIQGDFSAIPVAAGETREAVPVPAPK